MRTTDPLPENIQRLIPKQVEKHIYYRLYKLKDGSVSLKWWVKVWKDGKPIVQPANSDRYSDALALKKKLIADMENGHRAGGKVDGVRIPEIVDDYLNDCKVGATTLKEYKYTAEGFLKPLLKTVKAHKLNTDRLKAYRKERVAGIIAKKNPQTPEALAAVEKSANTTVNRDFALLRAAMNCATRLSPPKVLKVPDFPMKTEDNARQGFLEQEMYTRLRDAFKDPAVRLLFIVGYNIGCRSGELLDFEWSMVDLKEGVIRLPGRITKNGKPRTVPIFAGDYMDSLLAENAQHNELYPKSKWVFGRMGEPVRDFRHDWHRACNSVGLPELLFHDLRRTAVRNMTRIHGLDRATAKKISGHLTDSVFDRYDIIDEEDIKRAKLKVDANRTAPRSTSDPIATVPSELLTRLSGVSEDKLKAMVALLGV